MTKFIDIDNLGFFGKLYLILKGKLTIFVLKLNSKKQDINELFSSSINIYEKVLTDAEILQIYNATKKRYL